MRDLKVQDFEETIAVLAAAARADRDGWSRESWSRAAAAVADHAAAFLD